MIAVATTRGPQRRDYSGRLRECNAAAVGCSPDVVDAKVVQVPTFGLHALKGDFRRGKAIWREHLGGGGTRRLAGDFPV